MKKIIFLVLSLVVAGAGADEGSEYYKLHLVSPKSSIQLSPSTPAPTRYNLVDLNPTFVPGMRMRIQKNGSYNYITPTSPINSSTDMFARVLNSSGQGICSEFPCITPSPDYVSNVFRMSFENYFRIPTGAVAVEFYSASSALISPNNTDDSQSYGVFTNPLGGIGADSPILNLTIQQDVSSVCVDDNTLGVVQKNKLAEFKFKLNPLLSNLNINFAETKLKFSNWSGHDELGSIQPKNQSLGSDGLLKFDFLVPENLINPGFFYFLDVKGPYSNGTIDILMRFSGTIFTNAIGEIDIYQVIKNPVIFSPSAAIDLVAGKNADVIFQTSLGASVDITGTVLKWKSKDGQSVLTYSPKSNMTDSGGKIIFEIDPVPNSDKFYGGESTFDIELRKAVTSCGNNFLLGTATKRVHIRKTKPIRLEFTKIIRPALYASPTETLMNITKTKGVELTRIMYPVADADFSVKDAPLPVIGLSGGQLSDGFITDWNSLNLSRDIFNLFSSGNNTTHLVGFVSQAYLDYHNVDWVGVTAFKKPYFFIKDGEISVLSHELTHTYCVRFDGKRNCDVTEAEHTANVEHVLSLNDITGLIFSNYNASIINTSRDFLQSRKNIMYTDTMDELNGVPNERVFWFDEIGYLQLFYNNLENKNLRNLPTVVLNLSGSIDSFGKVNLQQVFLAKTSSIQKINRLTTGDYKINIFDKFKKLISSEYVNSDHLIIDSRTVNTGSDLIFNSEINLPIAATTIEIIKVQVTKSDQSPTVVVLPVDIMLNSLKYIPDSAYKIDKSQALNQMTGYLNQAKNLILNAQTDAANNILKTKFSTTINTSIKSDFQKSSLFDAGLLEFQNMIIYSMVKLDSVKPASYSSFFEIVPLNNPIAFEKSKIQVNFLNQPTNPESQMVFEVYFDNMPVNTVVFKNYLIAESTQLSTTSHNWQIRTYLVNKRIWNSFESNIKNWKNEKLKFQGQLEVETDPQKIQDIQNKIMTTINRISFFQSEKNNIKKEIGQPVNYSIEVQ